MTRCLGEVQGLSRVTADIGLQNQIAERYSKQHFSTPVGVVSLLSTLLSACAIPARMHSEMQLNDVALGCGLAMGELIQDEEQKKLLLMVRNDPSFQQRACVARWARRNGLKAVFVNTRFPAG